MTKAICNVIIITCVTMHMELLCTLEQRYIYSQSDQLNRTKEGGKGVVFVGVCVLSFGCV